MINTRLCLVKPVLQLLQDNRLVEANTLGKLGVDDQGAELEKQTHRFSSRVTRRTKSS